MLAPLLAAVVAVSIADPADAVDASGASGQTGDAPTSTISSTMYGGDSGLVVIPPALDLGAVPASATVARTVWVVNTSWQPVRVAAAKSSCGCARVEFEAVTLAPGGVRAVPFTITPPATEGSSRSVHLTFLPEWGMPAFFNCTLATSAEGAAATASPGPDDGQRIVFVPESAEIGPISSNTVVETSAWLINNGSVSVEVGEVTTEGVPTDVIGFAPTRIGPAQALRLRLRVVATPRNPAGATASAGSTVTLSARLSASGRTSTGTTRIRLTFE